MLWLTSAVGGSRGCGFQGKFVQGWSQHILLGFGRWLLVASIQARRGPRHPKSRETAGDPSLGRQQQGSQAEQSSGAAILLALDSPFGVAGMCLLFSEVETRLPSALLHFSRYH